MRIEDLLEFEGLTADHVRAWLQRKGFTLHEVRSGRQCWVRGTEAVTDDTLTASGTLVYLASVVAGCSVQSLMTEINPRMRPGWPTEEERARHRYWIAQGIAGALFIGEFKPDAEFGLILRGCTGSSLGESRSENWKFWPCDAHGNKVLRGTR